MGLKIPIKKIEAYDVSHISGDHAVASCIVFLNSGPNNEDYRLFNIPKELSGNDVGSLKHVMERRLKYYKDKETRPDIILIDGGRTQLKFAESVIKGSRHKDIKIISIVKGSDRVRATETILSEAGIIEFDKYSKAFLLLQEARDESHRFAIIAQRKKKRRSIKKSKLDEIDGIGEVIKKRLLSKYKSIKMIKTINIDDLMTVKGINAKIAKLIKEKL
jgi:excinuclease ABC subunit C